MPYRHYDREPIAIGIRVGSLLALAGCRHPDGRSNRHIVSVLLSLPVAINRVFVWGANLAGIGLILSAAGLAWQRWRRPTELVAASAGPCWPLPSPRSRCVPAAESLS